MADGPPASTPRCSSLTMAESTISQPTCPLCCLHETEHWCPPFLFLHCSTREFLDIAVSPSVLQPRPSNSWSFLFIYLFICISLACLGGLATSCEDIFINHLCEWVGVSEKRKIRTRERERMNLVIAARKQALLVWLERNGRVRQHFILIHFIIFKCCTTGTESRRTVVSHQLRSRCLLIFPA